MYNKEENSEDFCLDFVPEFSLWWQRESEDALTVGQLIFELPILQGSLFSPTARPHMPASGLGSMRNPLRHLFLMEMKGLKVDSRKTVLYT